MITLPITDAKVIDCIKLGKSEEFKQAFAQCFPLCTGWSTIRLFGYEGNGSYNWFNQTHIEELLQEWGEFPEEEQQQVINGEYILQDDDYLAAAKIFWCFQQKGLMEPIEGDYLFLIWW